MNYRVWVIVLAVVLSSCKEQAPPANPRQAKVLPKIGDLAEVIRGNIAPDPKLSNNRIARSQISDPKAVVDVVQSALLSAPSWTVGDVEAFDRHNEFVSKALSSRFPIGSEHWIAIQCGTSEPYGQRFMHRDVPSNTIKITITQYSNAGIEAVRAYDGLLVQTLSDYSQRLLSLSAQIPDMHIGLADEQYFAPLVKPLAQAEDLLGFEGSTIKITNSSRILLLNSPYLYLGKLRVENFVLRAVVLLNKALLSDLPMSLDLEDAIEKEKKFWRDFPATTDSKWYGEAAVINHADDVCLIARVKGLYPPTVRPGKLLDIGISKAKANDLIAELIGWFLVDRRTGEIVARST